MSDSEFGNEIPKRNERHPSLLPNARHSNASGFTLVELSIVLVIIGLLISGLLVGQSMIQAVRTQAFVRQIQQIDIAVSNFRTKYNYLPGDSPYHSAAGDGDGWIENSVTDAGTGSISIFNEETANFWIHLQQDGFLENDYETFSADASSGVDAGTHIPKATGAGSANAGIIISLDENFAKKRNEYWACDFSPTTDATFNSNTEMSAAFTPSQSLAIDVKIDDGLTGRGANPNIYGYNGNMWVSNYNDGGSQNDGRCYPTSTSNSYNTNNNLECCILIKMLSQQGGAN